MTRHQVGGLARTPRPLEIAIGVLPLIGIASAWVSQVIGDGRSIIAGFAFLMGYFTIWTNLLVAYVYLARRRDGFARGGVTVFILLVGLVYHFLLSADHIIIDRWSGVGNIVSHYLVPAVVVIDWLVFGPRAQLRWLWAAAWLVFPLIYTGIALLRGTLSGVYSYPFLDVGALGVAGVVREIAVLVIGFYIVGLAIIGVAKALPERRPALTA